MNEHLSPLGSTILPTSQLQGQMPWNKMAQSTGPSLIYQSDIMTQVVRVIERVAPSNANVLLLGESGTGKEIVAQMLHERSQRRGMPFVAINCGALRESLLESELFGHEKGSFTGAYNKKIGLAEAANGGTLFLDEVGELAPSVQAKLLRFLQEGEIYRVGGKDPIQVNIRLVCATNRDLEKEVLKGNFREDLYYRINTIVANIPPLRRRKEDIPLLIQHFLGSGAHAYLAKAKQVDPLAMEMLVKYEWPGNVRELQNLCERFQVLSEGHTIMVNDLPDNIRTPEEKARKSDFDPNVTLGDLERRYIIQALEHFDGNKTQAANALGITIKTLYNKLHEYGVFDKYAIHSKREGKETGSGSATL
jgi:DNA-binding NtrC family response regulator